MVLSGVSGMIRDRGKGRLLQILHYSFFTLQSD
jgi:hypothetical protein